MFSRQQQLARRWSSSHQGATPIVLVNAPAKRRCGRSSTAVRAEATAAPEAAEAASPPPHQQQQQRRQRTFSGAPRGSGDGASGGQRPRAALSALVRQQHQRRPPQQQQQQQQQHYQQSQQQQQQQQAQQAPFPYAYGYSPDQRWHLRTGLAVTFLGTSSGAPTKERNVSCMLLRAMRASYIVDSGEGSLAQLRRTPVGAGGVAAVFITHLHGDHCFGLGSVAAAVTAARAAAGAREGLRVYGPPGLADLMRVQLGLTGLQHGLALPLTVTELVENERDAHAPVPLNPEGTVLLARQAPDAEPLVAPPDLAHRLQRARPRRMPYQPGAGRSFVQDGYAAKPGLCWRFDFEDVAVTAAQLQHRVPCWGYVFDEKVPPLGDAAAWAPWRELWAADHVKRGRGGGGGGRNSSSGGGGGGDDGNASDADGSEGAGGNSGGEDAPPPPMPLLAPRRVVLLGDTMDSTAIAPAAVGADLLSHEATFASGMEAKAARAQHSTAWMAGRFARAVRARALVLTHFSARYKALGAPPSGAASTAPPQRPQRGGRGGGGRSDNDDDDGELPTTANTLRALVDEAAAEFRGPVCTAKDLFTVHVGWKPVVSYGGGGGSGQRRTSPPRSIE